MDPASSISGTPHMNLQLVSEDELIEELGSRFDAFVVCGSKIKQERPLKIYAVRKWHGNPLMCAAMCSQTELVINSRHLKESENVTNDE